MLFRSGGADVLLLPKSDKRRQPTLKVLNEADLILTVSDGLREQCIRLGADPSRVHTLLQGVDDSSFKPGNKAEVRSILGIPLNVPAYLWVGRMVGVKRVDLLLEAFHHLRGTITDAQLYLAGQGPLKEQLRSQVRAFGLNDNVHFVGPITQADLPKWYQAADATILTSSSEGLPNVLRESLACGTPFVSTNVGSISEIADPASSILVPANDVECLRAAITDILDPVYQSGAAQYQPRSWNQTARELVTLLHSPICKMPPSGSSVSTATEGIAI